MRYIRTVQDGPEPQDSSRNQTGGGDDLLFTGTERRPDVSNHSLVREKEGGREEW